MRSIFTILLTLYIWLPFQYSPRPVRCHGRTIAKRDTKRNSYSTNYATNKKRRISPAPRLQLAIPRPQSLFGLAVNVPPVRLVRIAGELAVVLLAPPRLDLGVDAVVPGGL